MSSYWSRLTSSIREPVSYSVDLIVVVVAAIGSVAVIRSVDVVLLEMLSGLALVLFLPGYALVSALFPRASAAVGRSEARANPGAPRDRFNVGGAKRIPLAVVGSLSVAIVLGFGLSYTWGVTLVSVYLSLCASTVLAAVAAVYRRSHVPKRDRFAAFRSVSDPSNAAWAQSRREFAVSAVAGTAVVTSTGAALYTVASPPRGETYTEFYLLTESDTGDLVADEYPREFEAGESRSVVIGIDNNEGESMEYAAVAEVQRVEEDGDAVTILDREELGEFTARVAPNDTHREPLELAPTMTGDRLRLAFHLYRGDRPADPASESSYRDLHLWIRVDESDGE